MDLLRHRRHQAANSLVGDQNLVKKVYFPRLVLPVAAVVIGVVDLAFAGLVLVGLMLFYGIVPSLTTRLLVVPLARARPGHGARRRLWFAALNVRYRDIRYVVPSSSRSGCS